MSTVPGAIDLCWLVMAFLNLASQRFRPPRIFLVYRPRGETSPIPCPACAPERLGRIENLRPKMGARRATFKRRVGPNARSPRALGPLSIDVKRTSLTFDDLGTDDDLFDAIEAGQFKHRVEQDGFHDRTEAAGACAALDCLLRDHSQRLFLNRQVGILHLEQPLILLDERVLWLGQNLLQGVLVEILKGSDDGQTADELGNEAEFQQVLRLDLAEHFARTSVVRRLNLGRKPNRGALATRRDDPLKTGKSPTANEQDIGRVDLQKFLLGVLASALWGNARNRPLHDFE